MLIVILAAGWYHLFREVPVAYASEDEYYKYGSVGTEAQAGIPYWVWRRRPRFFRST